MEEFFRFPERPPKDSDFPASELGKELETSPYDQEPLAGVDYARREYGSTVAAPVLNITYPLEESEEIDSSNITAEMYSLDHMPFFVSDSVMDYLDFEEGEIASGQFLLNQKIPQLSVFPYSRAEEILQDYIRDSEINEQRFFSNLRTMEELNCFFSPRLDNPFSEKERFEHLPFRLEKHNSGRKVPEAMVEMTDEDYCIIQGTGTSAINHKHWFRDLSNEEIRQKVGSEFVDQNIVGVTVGTDIEELKSDLDNHGLRIAEESNVQNFGYLPTVNMEPVKIEKGATAYTLYFAE